MKTKLPAGWSWKGNRVIAEKVGIDIDLHTKLALPLALYIAQLVLAAWLPAASSIAKFKTSCWL